MIHEVECENPVRRLGRSFSHSLGRETEVRTQSPVPSIPRRSHRRPTRDSSPPESSLPPENSGVSSEKDGVGVGRRGTTAAVSKPTRSRFVDEFVKTSLRPPQDVCSEWIEEQVPQLPSYGESVDSKRHWPPVLQWPFLLCRSFGVSLFGKWVVLPIVEVPCIEVF